MYSEVEFEEGDWIEGTVLTSRLITDKFRAKHAKRRWGWVGGSMSLSVCLRRVQPSPQVFSSLSASWPF